MEQNAASTLAHLQRLFKDEVTTGEESGLLSCQVKGRMDVYRDAYRIRILESLRDDFSQLETFLGESEFEAWVDRYLETHSSRFFSLYQLSGHFFKCMDPEVSPEAWHWAQLDWLRLLAKFSLDLEQVPGSDRESDDLRIFLHPSVRFYLTSLGRGVVWQKNGVVLDHALSDEAWDLLHLLNSPQSLDTVSERFAAGCSDPQKTELFFKSWTSQGVICLGAQGQIPNK